MTAAVAWARPSINRAWRSIRPSIPGANFRNGVVKSLVRRSINLGEIVRLGVVVGSSGVERTAHLHLRPARAAEMWQCSFRCGTVGQYGGRGATFR
jgi:hypothetical protein